MPKFITYKRELQKSSLDEAAEAKLDSVIVHLKNEVQVSNVDRLISFMDVWKVHHLKVELNISINNLLSVSLLEMKNLHLDNLEIESIERISRTFMPYLQNLSLKSNNFCKIKSLRKNDWTMLRSICLDYNEIMDGEYLISTPLKRVKGVSLGANLYKKKKISACWVFKMKVQQAKESNFGFYFNKNMSSQPHFKSRYYWNF